MKERPKIQMTAQKYLLYSERSPWLSFPIQTIKGLKSVVYMYDRYDGYSGLHLYKLDGVKKGG